MRVRCGQDVVCAASLVAGCMLVEQNVKCTSLTTSDATAGGWQEVGAAVTGEKEWEWEVSSLVLDCW